MTEKERQDLAATRHRDLVGWMKETHSEVVGVKNNVATLSREFALHEQKDLHVHNGQDERIRELEKDALATGEHKIVTLEATVEKHEKAAEKWRGRIWAGLGALALAALSAGLGYFAH